MCPAFSPAEVRALSACATVFVPGDPARAGSLAFFPAEGSGPPEVPGAEPRELSLVLPDEDGTLRVRPVRATLLPVAWALPVLSRARGPDDAPPASAGWGGAALRARPLRARG
ncbi:ATP-dependent helicase, partial [Streptomyces albidoflavus]